MGMSGPVRIELTEGTGVRVTGGMRIRVLDGTVMVLGAIFQRGEEFHVSPYRSYAVKALAPSRLEVQMDADASIEPAYGEEVIDKWVAVVDDLLRRDCRRIMVLGPTDSGKSSFTALVANRGLLRGLRPGIVDADVGQADIGPPGCVSAALVERKLLWLRELRARYMRFIGSITPHRFERRIVASVVDLAWRLQRDGADVVVIDTDGWTQGLQALEYKVEMARLLGVDAAIVLGDDALLAEMARRLFHKLPCGLSILPSPRVRRLRDRDDRRMLRSEAYRRYLEGSHRRIIDLSGVVVHGSCLFSGKLLDDNEVQQMNSIVGGSAEILLASETHDTIYVAVKGQLSSDAALKLAEAHGKQVYVLDVSMLEGALVALLGPDMEEKAIGIIREADLRNLRVIIETPYEGEVYGVIFGNIRLTEDLTETGRAVRCIV